jgi:hypothetical protein
VAGEPLRAAEAPPLALQAEELAAGEALQPAPEADAGLPAGEARRPARGWAPPEAQE